MCDIVFVVNKYLKIIEDDLEFKEYIILLDVNFEFLKDFIILIYIRCNNWIS